MIVQVHDVGFDARPREAPMTGHGGPGSKTIATLTMNPTIDIAYDVARLIPTKKLRTGDEIYSPGGGGLNVGRVLARLGNAVTCFFLSGGATGHALNELVKQQGIIAHHVAIHGSTRLATVVHEHETGQEFRLIPPGPNVTAQECQDCMAAVAAARFDLLVMSGSLPPGVPANFFARLKANLSGRVTKFFLDTSGEALSMALAVGGWRLIKPSLDELKQFCGKDLISTQDVGEAAMKLVRDGKAELVAVTLGVNRR
ncbi:MAG: 1-phosphofructokinase family hexose kinase [Sphingomonadales bacterium]|nr:1-phosphofructokinase family hexose kinase [Sphingomonadales bacterium]MDE2171674.1 1-phosphofructokinase family hexose kinase [Sphingomonadales bacterium]